jgi:hypothetical protein
MKLKDFIPDYHLSASEGLEDFFDVLDQIWNETKEDIDRFTNLVVPSGLSDEFLDFLALSLHMQVFPAGKWRWLIDWAGKLFKERGTLNSYRRYFLIYGANAFVKELHPEALILGTHGFIGTHRIVGKKYTHGSLLIVNHESFEDLRGLIEEYRPAGRILWSEYVKEEVVEDKAESVFDINSIVKSWVIERPASGIFIVGKSVIGGEDVLGWDVSISFASIKQLVYRIENSTYDFPVSIDAFSVNNAITYSYFVYPTEPYLFLEGSAIGRSSFAP